MGKVLINIITFPVKALAWIVHFVITALRQLVSAVRGAYIRFFGPEDDTALSDGGLFEFRCAEMLISRGFTDVELTKASRDQGVDIVARKGSELFAVQCKCYKKPVGNKAVQEVYAGMTYYGCTSAAVMTNSVFTDSAKELAESLGVELWDKVRVSGRRKRNPVVLFVSLAILAVMLIVHRAQPQDMLKDAAYWALFIAGYIIITGMISWSVRGNTAPGSASAGKKETGKKDTGK